MQEWKNKWKALQTNATKCAFKSSFFIITSLRFKSQTPNEDVRQDASWRAGQSTMLPANHRSSSRIHSMKCVVL